MSQTKENRVILEKAQHALYLPTDAAAHALLFVAQDELNGLLRQHMNATGQPQAEDLQRFAEAVFARFRSRTDGAPVSAFAAGWRRVVMLHASIGTMGHQLTQAFDCLALLVVALHDQRTGYDNGSPHPLVIPPALRDIEVHLDAAGESDDDVLLRLLDSEPFRGWLLRFFAQYHRTVAELQAITDEQRREVRLFDRFVNRLCENAGAAKRVRLRLRQSTRQSIKTLRRSLAFAGRIIGEDAVGRLLKGEPYWVQGQVYRYRISLDDQRLVTQAGAPSQGVIPYSLEVYRDDRELCTSCVYFNDTPTFDQIGALVLHLQHPTTEREILQTMHVAFMTKAFFAEGELAAMKGIRDPLSATPLTALIAQHFHFYLTWDVDDPEIRRRLAFADRLRRRAASLTAEMTGIPLNSLTMLKGWRATPEVCLSPCEENAARMAEMRLAFAASNPRLADYHEAPISAAPLFFSTKRLDDLLAVAEMAPHLVADF